MTLNFTAVVSGAMLLTFGLTACTSTVRPVDVVQTTDVTRMNGPLLARAFGSVAGKDSDSRTLEITHAPILDVDWPIMQMQFHVADDIDMSAYEPGDPIEFMFDFTNPQVPVMIAARHAHATDVIQALMPQEGTLPLPVE